MTISRGKGHLTELTFEHSSQDREKWGIPSRLYHVQSLTGVTGHDIGHNDMLSAARKDEWRESQAGLGVGRP